MLVTSELSETSQTRRHSSTKLPPALAEFAPGSRALHPAPQQAMVQLKEPDDSDGRHNGVHRLQDDDHPADADVSPTEQEEAEERAALLRFAHSSPTLH